MSAERGDVAREPDARECDEAADEPPQPRTPARGRFSLALSIQVSAPAWGVACPEPERLVARAARAALVVARANPCSIQAGVGAEAAAREALASNVPISLSILLAGRTRLRNLNRTFRRRDSSTDVLAFPDGSRAEDGKFALGDLALGLEDTLRTARAFGLTPSEQLQHLVCHGTLHLLGHRHNTAAETRAMRALEAQACARLKIRDPWQRAPWMREAAFRKLTENL